MKVTLVNQPWNPFLPPVEQGSIAIWNDRIARQLAARGLEVVVLGGTDAVREQSATEEGVRFRAVPLGWDRRLEKWARRRHVDPHRPRILTNAAWAGFRRRLVRTLRDERADLIHVHNLAHLAGPIRRALPGARVVVHMHSEWLSQLDHGQVAKMLAPVDAVVACTPHVARPARAAHPGLEGRCFDVPNGVDVEAFMPAERELDATPHVLFVGRLSPEKGLHVLLPAFARVLSRLPAARLTIVGPEGVTPRALLADLSDDDAVRALAPLANGRYAGKLRDLATPLGESVRFVGAVPQRALPALYHDADVIALPSFYESFGIPVIEAMACGKPVVAGRAGGLTDIVVDGVEGLLVEPGDEVALADALVRLLEDPSMRARLGGAGRTAAVERYAWPRVADRLLEVWSRVGAEHG